MTERNEGKERELRGGNVVGDVLFLLFFIGVLVLSYLVTTSVAKRLGL